MIGLCCRLESSDQSERDLTSRLTEQQTTIDKLTWEVRKFERETVEADTSKTAAVERAARAEQQVADLTKRIERYEGEGHASQQLNKTLGTEVRELKDQLLDEKKEKESIRIHLKDSEDSLRREKGARKEWASTRLQLLQEICDEESKLQSELDSWDSTRVHYSYPSGSEIQGMYNSSGGDGLSERAVRESGSGGGRGTSRRSPLNHHLSKGLMTPMNGGGQ